MRHYRPKNSVMPSKQTTLLKQTFLILDSKIQYINHQVQNYFEHYTCSSSNAANTSPLTQSTTFVKNLDDILTYVESLQTNLKLLQLLRAWLQEETAPEIYALLSSNTYSDYSEEKLEKILKQKALYLLRMKASC